MDYNPKHSRFGARLHNNGKYLVYTLIDNERGQALLKEKILLGTNLAIKSIGQNSPPHEVPYISLKKGDITKKVQIVVDKEKKIIQLSVLGRNNNLIELDEYNLSYRFEDLYIDINEEMSEIQKTKDYMKYTFQYKN